MKQLLQRVAILFFIALTACGPAPPPPTETLVPTPTQWIPPTGTPDSTPTPLPTPTTPSREILLAAPEEGAAVASPVEVEGRVSVMPFEATLRGRVYDAQGRVVGEKPIWAEADVEGDLGGPGTFAGTIPFQVETTGPGRVEVAEISARDGSIVVSATVAVTLTKTPPPDLSKMDVQECSSTSPDGMWVARGLAGFPKSNGGNRYYTRLTVARSDASPPPTPTHVVQEGDTLQKIADQYGVTVDDLLAANDLEDGEIAVGDTLVIPEPQPGAAAAPTVQSPFEIGETVEISGVLHATIYEGEDSRRVQAVLVVNGQPRYSLSGPLDVLEDIAQLDGLHVRVCGEAVSAGGERSLRGYVVEVESFEKVWPEEQVEGFLGHIEEEALAGETVAIFTDHETEQRYVVASSLEFEGPGPSVGPYPSTSADQHFVVGVVEPGRSFARMPVLRIHRMHKDSQTDAATSADEIPLEVPRVVDESHTFPGPFAGLEGALLVDRVELAYYYKPTAPYPATAPDGTPLTPEPLEQIVQPVWVFSGHDEDDTVRFTAYVQAAADDLIRETNGPAPATPTPSR